MMRAFLFARATAATFLLRRAISLRSQLSDPALFSAKRMTARAPWISKVRRVSVATFADAKQRLFAATGSLFWNQSEPCRKLPAVLEFHGISHCCNNGARRDRTNTWNGLQSLTGLVLLVPQLDLQLQFFHLTIQFFEVVVQSF